MTAIVKGKWRPRTDKSGRVRLAKVKRGLPVCKQIALAKGGSKKRVRVLPRVLSMGRALPPAEFVP